MAKRSTASFPQEKLVRMSATDMRKPLTRKQRQEIEALAAKPDSEIDFSDIPETVGNEVLRPAMRSASKR